LRFQSWGTRRKRKRQRWVGWQGAGAAEDKNNNYYRTGREGGVSTEDVEAAADHV